MRDADAADNRVYDAFVAKHICDSPAFVCEERHGAQLMELKDRALYVFEARAPPLQTRHMRSTHLRARRL